MNKPLRVLIVEDSPLDTELLLVELRRHGYEPQYERVETRPAMEAALERQNWDVVVADYNLPQFSAPEALEVLHAKRIDLPFIISTGSMPEEAAVDSMRAGADDYVLKNNLARLIPAIEREVGAAAGREAHKLAEASLKDSEALKAAILEAALDAIITMDHRGLVVEFNPAAEAMFGYTREQAVGKPLANLIMPPAARAEHQRGFAQYLETGKGRILGKRVEMTAMRADGAEFPAELAVTRILRNGPPMFAGTIRDLTERNRVEKQLLHLASVPEQSPNRIIELDSNWNVTYCNPAATAQFPDLKLRGLQHPMLAGLDVVWTEMEQTGKNSVVREIRVDSRYYHQVICSALERRCIRVHAADITDQKRLEEQLYRTQKMQAIEQLAGGIAHHFNNLMAGVKGFSEIMLLQLRADDPLHRYAEQIREAADRAALLTHQLLAFSRNVPREVRSLNLNATIEAALPMLHSLLREAAGVELAFAPGRDLWTAKADPVQIEQLLLHLVTNARDAMSSGGTIALETANVALDEEYARQNEGVLPGEYVMLGVSDTGTGMTEEVQAHIFEPFFTTKDQGKGTGLGLATCYAIAQQSGGYIRVSSVVDRGTIVRAYLPRVRSTNLAPPGASQEHPATISSVAANKR